MATNKTIIIVGGAHGGTIAASKARQCDEHARIILVEQASHFSLNKTSLRHQLLNEMPCGLSEHEWFSKTFNVEVLTETHARSLDMDARCLVVQNSSGLERLPFNTLIFAGGAVSDSLAIPELSGPRVCYFRGIDDLKKIRHAMNTKKRAVIVGGGLYGVDAAMSLSTAGFSVTMLEKKKRIMPRFSLQCAERMRRALEKESVVVKLGTTITDAQPEPDGGFVLGLSSGETLDCDLVVVCVGISPRTSILADAGAALDSHGLIRVDDFMATSLPGVFACGSTISVPYAVTNERKWIPQPAVVVRTAQIAGCNAAVTDVTKQDAIKPFSGTVIAAIGDTHFARTGLSEHEARECFGDDVLVVTVFGTALESFSYQHEMCVKLVLDKASRRIVGGEVFGKQGVERRIDLLSVAVVEGHTPDWLLSVDMAFLEHAAVSFDPLKDAAQRAIHAMRDNVNVMTAEMLAMWLKSERDFHLVDVSDSPLLSGHIAKRTTHVPLLALRTRIDELSTEKPIVLYSKSGHQSYLAHLALRQRGVEDVYHLDGGFATFQLVAAKE